MFRVPSPLISDEQKEEGCLTRVLQPVRLVYLSSCFWLHTSPPALVESFIMSPVLIVGLGGLGWGLSPGVPEPLSQTVARPSCPEGPSLLIWKDASLWAQSSGGSLGLPWHLQAGQHFHGGPKGGVPDGEPGWGELWGLMTSYSVTFMSSKRGEFHPLHVGRQSSILAWKFP